MLTTKSMKMLPLAINIRQLSRGIDISQQIGALSVSALIDCL